MRPKNFRAPTPKQVLSKISRELGPDATIVSHKEIQDSKGRPWVEATASPNVEGVVPDSTPLISEKITAKLSLKKLFVPALVFITLAALFLLSVFLIRILPSRNPILPTHKQIVFTGNAFSPAISPDGKFLAYVNYETFDEQKVMVQDMASGKAIEVFSCQEIWALRWLPDGSELSFCGGKDDDLAIFVVPRLGGTVRRLEAGAYFAWSPDGSRIARTWVPWKKITITNESSGETTSIPLESSFTFIKSIDWSPIGNFFLFLTIDEENRYAIWTITTDGTTQHKVVEDDVPLFSPCWSPGGNTIYYFRQKRMQKELWKIPVSTDTGEPIKSASLVLPDLQAGDYFALTSEGTKMLYTREIRSSNLWLATVDGSGKSEKVKIKQLTKDTLWNKIPSISPGGNLIAFRKGDAEKSNIYVMPIEGGSPKQITFFNSLNGGPVWSPDGTEIAFGSNEGGEFKVWKVNSQGGRPIKFVQSQLSRSHLLAWFPGENILYHRPGNRNFFILNPVTEEERPLVQDDSVGWVFAPRYSPDGKKVAVMWNRRPSRGLWVIPLEDSSQAFLLKENAFPVGWSADGRWIYASEEIRGTLKILKISIKGDQTKIILTAPFTLEKGFPRQGHACMTLDGKNFVFPVYKYHSDVWMIENFDPEMK
jgi:Tol biopolymer transport system component